MFTKPTRVRGAARTKTETQALAHDLVTEYDKRHGPHADLWMLGEFLVGVIRAAWWALRIVARFPIVTFVVALVGYAHWEYGHAGPALVCAALLVGLLSWRVMDGDSFSEFVTWRVWSNWRAWRTYGRHWDSAMWMAGLGDRYLGEDYVPVLLNARCRPNVDRLTVQLLQGQHPDDFAAQADTLAHTFGALACRSRIAGPGVITLEFTRTDQLAELVPALDVHEGPDLAAIAFGRREDGGPMTAKLRGSHTLIAGATGAGKGSVLWSLIRAVGPLVRDRLVALWVCDPKGGMELSAGEPLFTRFAYETTDAMAELLEDAVTEMRTRAARLRGKVRLHTPTVDEPLIVVVIDELAALTAYTTDRDERKRISAALSLLLSQGRAVGVVVVAALQDPRKEVLQQRDLFPTRIALRLIEREATDMVLGPGARDRGAECDRIDPSTPGVGFMWCDGEAEPTRFRAGFVTDDDIAEMVELYRPGGPPPAAVTADAPEDAPAPPAGGMVIDLADMAGRTS